MMYIKIDPEVKGLMNKARLQVREVGIEGDVVGPFNIGVFFDILTWAAAETTKSFTQWL
jgi:hypothetical protein